MSTNVKLGLALGVVVLVGIGVFVGVSLVSRGTFDGVVAMDHGNGGASPSASVRAAPVEPAARSGRLLLVTPRGRGLLDADTGARARGLRAVRAVTPFLLVRQRDGSFVQGVTVRGGRAFGFAEGEQIVLREAAVLRSSGGRAAALAGSRYAKTHKTAYGYPIATMAGHQPPLNVGSLTLTLGGVFRSATALDDMLVVELAVSQRAFSRSGRVSGFFVEAGDPAAAKRALARAFGANVVVRQVSG